jgi:phage tail-like protein
MTALISNPSQFLSPTLVGALAAPVQAPSSPDKRIDLGLAMRFLVEVGGLNLGHWQSCNGLRVNFQTTAVQQGGEYRRRTLIPEQVEYGDITLKRAVTADGSKSVAEWLRTAVDKWVNCDYTGDVHQPSKETATITVLDAHGKSVYAWTLDGVYPKSWSGPELDASSSRVAVETLVFSYDGFYGWI